RLPVMAALARHLEQQRSALRPLQGPVGLIPAEAHPVGPEQAPVPVVDQRPARVDQGGGGDRDRSRAGARDQRRAAAPGLEAREPEPGADEQEEERAARQLTVRLRPGNRNEIEADEQYQRRDPSRRPVARGPERR